MGCSWSKEKEAPKRQEFDATKLKVASLQSQRDGGLALSCFSYSSKKRVSQWQQHPTYNQQKYDEREEEQNIDPRFGGYQQQQLYLQQHTVQQTALISDLNALGTTWNCAHETLRNCLSITNWNSAESRNYLTRLEGQIIGVFLALKDVKKRGLSEHYEEFVQGALEMVDGLEANYHNQNRCLPLLMSQYLSCVRDALRGNLKLDDFPNWKRNHHLFSTPEEERGGREIECSSGLHFDRTQQDNPIEFQAEGFVVIHNSQQTQKAEQQHIGFKHPQQLSEEGKEEGLICQSLERNGEEMNNNDPDDDDEGRMLNNSRTVARGCYYSYSRSDSLCGVVLEEETMTSSLDDSEDGKRQQLQQGGQLFLSNTMSISSNQEEDEMPSADCDNGFGKMRGEFEKIMSCIETKEGGKAIPIVAMTPEQQTKETKVHSVTNKSKQEKKHKANPDRRRTKKQKREKLKQVTNEKEAAVSEVNPQPQQMSKFKLQERQEEQEADDGDVLIAKVYCEILEEMIYRHSFLPHPTMPSPEDEAQLLLDKGEKLIIADEEGVDDNDDDKHCCILRYDKTGKKFNFEELSTTKTKYLKKKEQEEEHLQDESVKMHRQVESSVSSASSCSNSHNEEQNFVGTVEKKCTIEFEDPIPALPTSTSLQHNIQHLCNTQAQYYAREERLMQNPQHAIQVLEDQLRYPQFGFALEYLRDLGLRDEFVVEYEEVYDGRKRELEALAMQGYKEKWSTQKIKEQFWL